MISVKTVRVVVSALLAIVAWLALLLQLRLSIQFSLSNGKSIANGLIVFLGYFTILTNIFMALVGTAGAFSWKFKTSVWLYRPPMVGCATTSILLVGIAYHLLLRDIWSPQGAQLIADNLLHYVIPIGALAHWLFYRRTDSLAVWMPFAWSLYPIIYLVYALTRGELLGYYPYPFIDVTALGYQQVIINALGLLSAFVALGFAVLGVDRIMTSRSTQ
ncbi:Pr6Pr family membrane protein [Acidihalobacter prosperus]|uniref:Pr6Pr family membrane protein n=1 Tax=Acidihalobacter prosperus TaxID=160660 RepID=UPI000507CC47|nr:Pr6Pr family membrane protein [Acidihalobacter prosperus]